MLPIGQALWLKELETYAASIPPLQDPASYNLEQVMQQDQEHEGRSTATKGQCHPAGASSAPAGQFASGSR